MAVGPFNLFDDAELQLNEQPLSQTGSHQQVSCDWINDRFYSTQIINGGVLLPGEVAPAKTQAQRARDGDLAITEFSRTGTITGVMYVRSMGHGVALNAEPVGSDTYLWMECDAALDGTFSYGLKVGRLQFINGATVDSSSPAVEKFDPVPGTRRVFNTIDFQNNRIAVSWADATPARLRTYKIFDLADFRLGIYTLIVQFPRLGVEGQGQNSCLYGDYIYQMEGTAYNASNSPPGNCYISVMNINDGSLVERVFNDTNPGLSHREPESIFIDYFPPEPKLVFGFSTNAPAPVRFITLYNYSLYEVVPPGPLQYWAYTTNTVEEAPFAWNSLHERFRMPRGISVQETTPGLYEEVRYAAYTDENGSANLPRDTAYQSQEFYKNLNFFRGGYEHIVDDNVKSALISSGVATSSNFVLIP